VKFIAKLILTLLFIPMFLLFIFAVNLRSQILAPTFWERTFDSQNVYSKISNAINKNLESRAVAEGGKPGDVKIITDIISPENLKDTINKNIYNVLLFANGKSKEIIVYIPVNKIPKELLLNNFGGVTENMKLSDVIKEFNVNGITDAQILMISRVGITAWIFLLTTSFLIILILYFLYLLVDSGKRLITPGMALILSGLAAYLINISGTAIRNNWTIDLSRTSNLGDLLIGIITPPIIQGILKMWSTFALTAVVAGFILFFIKKPGYIRKSK
jgi:uncharacterized protein YpmB